MTIREALQQHEKYYLSPYATQSADTRGREKPISPCDMRTPFQRDRDRIVHSKSFRRLMHKTQMFLSPEGDHYRTRLTHTMEVSQIARTLARCLRLNEDLTEAIALGHDLGHTPFGHTGERTLNALMPGGFRHSEQSLRVVEVLENQGEGLNLTWEVRDGIAQHTMSGHPATLEGACVSLADRIAYINHDIDDAIRGGKLSPDQLPRHLLEVLGQTHGQRIENMIWDIMRHSQDKPYVAMSDQIGEATLQLRQFLFENVYRYTIDPKEEERAAHVMSHLFAYYLEHPNEMSDGAWHRRMQAPLEVLICDYVAGMSDGYALRQYRALFMPTPYAD
nr:deoxyguanosinetriphosphate triphosphohydrolase [bacterium]